uniref:SRCR domain-containing protein n=1 Tax=Sparus aurata TaxID=8175 RepID=A0A671VSG7_SPAAU
WWLFLVLNHRFIINMTLTAFFPASVRLFNGTNRCSGRVEVSQGGQWWKICNSNWGQEESTRLCKELGCGPPKNSQESFHFGDTRLKGTAKATTLQRAPTVALTEDYWTSLGDHNYLGVTVHYIDEKWALVDGTDRCSGRVEVMHGGQWGTVCDDEWDIRDAEVVCRVIDCGTAQTAKTNAFFGPGQGNIWLDDVSCLGNETSLMHCRHPPLGENNCGHGEDAGVVCSGIISVGLINGTGQCSGRVEFSHGDHWSPTFNFNWGMNEATVVCREMNCGDPVKFTGSYGQGGAQRGYKVSCSGRESSLSQCTLTEYVQTSSDHMEEAAVECSGKTCSSCAYLINFHFGIFGQTIRVKWTIKLGKLQGLASLRLTSHYCGVSSGSQSDSIRPKTIIIKLWLNAESKMDTEGGYASGSGYLVIDKSLRVVSSGSRTEGSGNPPPRPQQSYKRPCRGYSYDAVAK